MCVLCGELCGELAYLDTLMFTYQYLALTNFAVAAAQAF